MMLNSGKTDKALDKIEKIKVNVKKLEEFIAGFTDGYELTTEKSKADINKAIDNVTKYLSTKRSFNNITISSQFDSKINEFDFDTDQISKLMLNLIVNSAEAINESEIKKIKK